MPSSQPSLGFCIMYPSPGTIERIGPDWDWVWIDGQHGQIATYNDTLAMVRTCNLMGLKAFVRVAGHEPSPLSLAADMGADGIIVPQVETAEEARKLAKACKFPPVGERSYGARRCIDLRGRLFVENANEQLELICQIESPEALARAEEIAAVPGVDGLFLGPDDFMLRQGLAMNHPRSRESLGEALTQLMQACQRHGKRGMAVAIGEGIPELCLELGYHYLVGGTDVGFLAAASRQASTELKETLAKQASATPAPETARRSLY